MQCPHALLKRFGFGVDATSFGLQELRVDVPIREADLQHWSTAQAMIIHREEGNAVRTCSILSVAEVKLATEAGVEVYTVGD